MKQVTLACARCGVKFTSHPASCRKFCSLSCNTAYRNSLKKTPASLLVRKCKHCSSAFQLSKPSDTKKFCSLTCKARYWNPRKPPTGHAKRDRNSPFKPYMNRVNRTVRNDPKKGPTDLTHEFLRELWDAQSGKCAITGFQLTLPAATGGHIRKMKPIARPSLDRIDSSKPYTKDNVQWVSIFANYAKSVWSTADTVKYVEAVRRVGIPPKPVSTVVVATPRDRVFESFIVNKKKKGRKALSAQLLRGVWIAQGERCPITGWELKFQAENTPDKASLDRYDPTGGYELGNVRIVALIANYAKGKLSDAEVCEMCGASSSVH